MTIYSTKYTKSPNKRYKNNYANIDSITVEANESHTFNCSIFDDIW